MNGSYIENKCVMYKYIYIYTFKRGIQAPFIRTQVLDANVISFCHLDFEPTIL